MSFLKRLLGLEFLDEMSKVVRRGPPAPLPPAPVGYRIYTTEFDETISLVQIPARVEPLTSNEIVETAELKRQFTQFFIQDRLQMQEPAAAFIRRLVSRLSQDQRAKTVVTILIDQSGSMRGMGTLSAFLAAEALWGALDRCGVPSEFIGFTTCSWKGGKSRAKWIKAGRPANPGRLCDLRYILYRSATDERGKRPPFAEALYSGLLRENVDGEAILYAVDRLEGRDWERKAVVVVSDGAPVDDSTIASNSDKDILVVHLKEVISQTLEKGIGIGYVRLAELGGDFLPENSAIALEPVAAAKTLFEVTARALGLDPDHSDLDPANA